MTVVSRKKFATNQSKYFDIAMNERIFVQSGDSMFHFGYNPISEQPVLEPDDDLRRAITIDELKEKIHKRIHKLFENESTCNSGSL